MLTAISFRSRLSSTLSIATCVLIFGSLTPSQQSAAQTTAPLDSVPFVIPGDDTTKTVTNFSRLFPAPVRPEFNTVRDGKFYIGDSRLRFWGVNLCFGANFPSHEEADKIAPHFAKLGINSVRIHHMDMQDAPNGIWKTLPSGKRELDESQVDRFDYFLNRLHENGIYANINLHVSRTLSEKEGYPQSKSSAQWWASSNKWVMYYDPDVQAELKKYCRDLLTHENPYRKLRRVDDPGIAVVEMLNENYFSKQGIDLLQHLPDRFVNSFGATWNKWLTQKYDSTEAMSAAWSANTSTELKPLVKSAEWANSLDGWELNMQQPQLARKFKTKPPTEVTSDNANHFAIRLEAQSRSEQAHFQQLSRRNISVSKGQPYTLSFWVRADKNREFNFEVSTAAGEWRPLGVFETGTATAEWQEIQRVFFPEETIEKEAYIALSIGADGTPIEFAGVTLKEGVTAKPLPANQTIENGNIGVPESGWPLAAHQDLKTFLVDTERSWILELKQYLRELGVKVPITASQENYHADGILAETCDYVDLHNYWHHPTFPAGKSFNPTDYRTGNDPMEAAPTTSSWPTNSLLMRTGWRYHGMPFTLSEWNHAEPSDVSTGAVMMAAALGSIQDWDGVFFFDYEAFDPDWFRDNFEGFFEMNSQPAKLATFSVAANIFLRGDLPAIKSKRSGTYTDRLDGRLAFSHRLGVDPKATKADSLEISESLKFATPTGSLSWNAAEPSTGHLKIDTPKTQGAWGLVANQEFELADFDVTVGAVARDYATVIATSLDDKSLRESGSILLLTSSGAENTAMKWNADRTSVSDQWGTGPTLVNRVSASVKFRSALANSLKVYELDGTGKRTKEVPTTNSNGALGFEIGERQKTIWFEISNQ
jgi:hypothetical protein